MSNSLKVQAAAVLAVFALGAAGLLAGENILSDDFTHKSLEGWSIESSIPANGGHAFDAGALVLQCREMGKQTLTAKAPVPHQHKVIFEFCEGPGSDLRWDIRCTRGISKFDGLPFVVYQLERDEKLGFWTRSEQGWISNLPGVSALGLRDTIAGVQAGHWYRVLLQNDDVTTLMRIWSLPDEKVVYERKLRHDAAASAIRADSEGYVSFDLYNYQLQPKETQLKIRNVSISSTGEKIAEDLGKPQPPPMTSAPATEAQQVTVTVPSRVEFEVQTSGAWKAGTANWTLAHRYTNGIDCTPYLSPQLTIGSFTSFGLKKDTQYLFKVQFTEQKDFIRIEQLDTGALFNEFILEHKPTKEVKFLLKDEKSQARIGKVTRTAGAAPEAAGKTAAPPDGYELLFEDDFSNGLGKWGATGAKTCGFLRLERFRHWCESGILEIPYLSASDCILEAEVNQSEGPNGFGILFRKDADDDSSFCMFKVNTKQSCSFANGFSFENDNKIPVALETGARLGGMLQPRKWHTVKVVADGDRMAGYVDGYKSAEYTNSTVKKGGIALSVDTGTELYVRSFRVYVKKGSQYAYKPSVEKGSEPRLAPISDPFPLVPQETADAKVFRDAKGRDHYYRVENDKLLYDGQLYCPVKGSDGQYFVRYEPNKWPASAYESLAEKDGGTIEQIKKFGLTYQIVPTQISTYIDCTKEESGFSEDNGLGGASRLLEIYGVKYRVSSARKSKNNYFLYETLFPKLGCPYVMVYQVPNDRYRITCVCPLPPESGSAGVITGGPFALDHKSHNMMHLFYPLQEKYEFCIYHQEVTHDWSPQAGAAVANIWFLLVEDSLENLSPLVDQRKDLPARMIGTLDQAPGFTRRLYGMQVNPADKLEKHQAAMANYVDYVKFCGGNLVNYYFLGNDWALDGQVHYPSKIYEKILANKHNYLEQFLPVADKEGIATYPRIASFTASEVYRQKTGISTDALIVNKNGDYCSVFTNRIWDPLHPEVQDLCLRTVEELARLAAPHPSVKGLCLDLGPGGWFNSQEIGYSRRTVEQFQKDTGINVPRPEKGTPYEWLKKNCWNAWLDWRCLKLKEFYCLMRDRIAAARGDLKLQLKFNVGLWTDFGKHSADQQRQYLRELGIDPALYHGTGIQFACGFVYHDKYLYPDKSMSFDKIAIPIKERRAMVDIVSYYELPAVLPKISPHFVGWLATVNLTPVDRHVLELAACELRTANVEQVEFMRWEKAIAQMEHLLRRYGTAFRALPAVEPKEFEGQMEVLSGKASDETLAIRWYADRLMVLNDNPEPRRIRITIPQGLSANGQLVELGWNRTLVKGPSQDKTTVEIDLQPYDLQVLAMRRGPAE